MPVFDCDFNIRPVCPYCGEKQDGAWELGLEDYGQTTTDCQNCELPFKVTAHYTVRYDTKPIDPATVREICIANDLEIPDCVKS